LCTTRLGAGKLATKETVVVTDGEMSNKREMRRSEFRRQHNGNE